MVLLFVICSLASEHFLTLANLVNICQQYSGTVIVSIGMLFVILTGGIDLSVGSVMALGSVFSAYAMVELHLPIIVSVILSMILGTVCGLITGILVAKAKDCGVRGKPCDDDYLQGCRVHDFKWHTD